MKKKSVAKLHRKDEKVHEALEKVHKKEDKLHSKETKLHHKAEKAEKDPKPKKKFWISEAIQHPGALRKELHVKKGKKIPKGKLKKAAKAKGAEGKRARLALTLSKMRKKKK